MPRGHLAAIFSALTALVLLADSASAQAIRRTIYASALDSSGAPVQNLSPEDLVVREDKVAREVLDVWPATDPMEIAILVDNSQAADSFVRDYREALPAFINGIAADESGAKHQVAIITLADRPTINTDYTLDLATAVKGAQRIFALPATGAYLLDGIIETSKGISKRSAVRPVIVVVATEGPEMSDRSYQSVLEPLRASGAPLYVIVVGRPVNNDNDRAVVLGLGTKESGGAYDNIFTGTALTPRLKQLAAELTHQYRVTYARPQTLIQPEQVTIGAARSGLTVHGAPGRDTQERR